MRLLLAIAMLAGVSPAPAAFAAPRSIADCEKIEAALAYNECLASFGPAASHSGGGGRHLDPQSGAPPAIRIEGGRGRRHAANDLAGATTQRRSGGRVHMEFTPRR
jgi:hypothetical protein